MNAPPVENASAEAESLLISWARDLCTCTEDELRERWAGQERAAIDKLDPEGFEARVAKHSFLYYLAENLFFDNVRGDKTFLDPDFHRERICRPVEAYVTAGFNPQDPGLELLAQRDSFKSTFQHGVTPVGCSLRDYHIYRRHVRVCLMHQKLDLASQNLVRVKQRCINSAWFHKVWWEFHSKFDFGTKTEFDWPCKPPGIFSEPSFTAASIDTDLTGKHFDWMFCSDLVTEEQRNSKLLRTQTIRKFQGVKYTLDSKTGKLMIDGTLYHPGDLNTKLAKDDSGYRVIKIGAGGKRAEKPLSLPHRHTEEFLEAKYQEEIRINGNADLWWMQRQNIIDSPNIRATNLAYLRYCTQASVPLGSWRVIFVDPAWKGTDNAGEGDAASIQVWAFYRSGPVVLKYLLDGVHSRELTDAGGKDEILRLARAYYVTDVAPEERGGYSFRGSLANEAATRGVYLNVIKLKSMQVNKGQRIATFFGTVEAGRVLICEECDSDLRQAFEEQYEAGQQCIGDDDDAVDCAAYTEDPAISESYMPRFNFEAMVPQEAELMYQPRTRYGAM